MIEYGFSHQFFVLGNSLMTFNVPYLTFNLKSDLPVFKNSSDAENGRTNLKNQRKSNPVKNYLLLTLDTYDIEVEKGGGV